MTTRDRGLIVSKKTVEGKKSRDGLIRLIDRGTEILAAGAAAVTSGAVALLLGEGPEAKAIGGLASKGIEIVLRDVGTDISSRQLGPREEIRVGAALIIAAAEIKRRLKNGEVPRTDGFFDGKETGRSDAEEILEAVLLKAQREPEDKKIQYMGYLLSSIAFDSEINLPYAHQLIKVAEQLTYRQLCILKLCVVKEEYQLRDRHYKDPRLRDKALNQILHECHNLYTGGYVHHKGKLGIGDTEAFVPTDLNPRSMALIGLGVDLYDLMRLSLIPDKDVDPIAEVLK